MILKNEKKTTGEDKLYDRPGKYATMGWLDIFTDIGEHVNLVQLIDSIGNVDNDISVVWYWIFDSNYVEGIVLNRE